MHYEGLHWLFQEVSIPKTQTRILLWNQSPFVKRRSRDGEGRVDRQKLSGLANLDSKVPGLRFWVEVIGRLNRGSMRVMGLGLVIGRLYRGLIRVMGLGFGV